jgi:hypothetical protein
MLREMQSYIWDGSAAKTVALVFAILSVFAAFYAHFVLTRLTRRTQFADKQFGAEVDPWMTEARRNYAKDKLVGRSGKAKL